MVILEIGGAAPRNYPPRNGLGCAKCILRKSLCVQKNECSSESRRFPAHAEEHEERRRRRMRIGIGLHDRRLVAARVHSDGTSSMLAVPAAPDGLEAALDRLLDGLAAPGDPGVRSIAFDVSGVLHRSEADPLTVVRIAPRPPVEHSDEPRIGDAPILHVRGGHTTLGEELAPFDAESFRSAAQRIPRGSRVVITSAGALVNPAHELAAGDILLDHDATLRIAFSHAFDSNSFATRERTAVLASALAPGAEALATSLALVTGRRFPEARLSVTRNDGGRAPLSRLPAAPVHSSFSGPPIEFLGAAALCRLDEGDLVLATAEGPVLGSVRTGAPTVVPQLRWDGARLSTQAAHLVPATEILLHGRTPAPRLVRAAGVDLPDWLNGADAVETDLDLRALGAACAPLSDWALGIVGVVNAAEMAHELQTAEARVRARLAAFGALPSTVRILESRLVATTYEHARVVSVRVHGVAGESAGEMLSEGGRRRAAER